MDSAINIYPWIRSSGRTHLLLVVLQQLLVDGVEVSGDEVGDELLARRAPSVVFVQLVHRAVHHSSDACCRKQEHLTV